MSHSSTTNKKLNIGIIGCGWLGQHIAKHLNRHRIFTTTTSAKKKEALIALGYQSMVIKFGETPTSELLSWNELHHLDVIIITVPFSKRHSIASLQNRFEHLCQFIQGFDKQLFLMSSIGIYPEMPVEIWENTLHEQELNPNLLGIEELFKENFPQTNTLRLGGLMGGSRVFSNYNVEPTAQAVNHVHYEDICLIIERMMIKNSAAKMYHVVAPMHPTKEEVIAYQTGKNNTISNPPFGKIVHSDAVQKELDYQFKHPDPRTFL